MFLKITQISQENICVGVSLIKFQTLRLATLLKKTPTQLFFSEIYKIFKNTFFYKTPPVAAFANWFQ